MNRPVFLYSLIIALLIIQGIDLITPKNTIIEDDGSYSLNLTRRWKVYNKPYNFGVAWNLILPNSTSVAMLMNTTYQPEEGIASF